VRWLFYVEREFHAALFAPLAREIRSRGLGEMGAWSTAYQVSGNGLRTFGARPERVLDALGQPLDIVGDPVAWKPDITFIADSSYENCELPGRIVNIGHGTICKGSFFTAGPRGWRENCADLLCVPGEVHREALSRRVHVPIEVTGMPKLDALFGGNLPRDVVLKAWGFDREARTVLVAPTFNPEYSLVPHLGYNLRRWIPASLNLLLKLHAAAPPEWLEGYAQALQGDPAALIVTDDDITPCLAAADVVISDVSSVVFEAMAAGKPVIAFDSPTRATHPRYDENDLEWRFRDAARRFSSPEQLEALLFRALTEPQSSLATDTGRRFVSVRDGSSARRVVDAATHLVREAPRRPTLLLRNPAPRRLGGLLALHGARCDVLVASDTPVPHQYPSFPIPLRLLDLLRMGAARAGNEFIVFTDTDWALSPCAVRLLAAHLQANPSLGLVAPLLPQGTRGEQEITRHIPQVAGLPPQRIVGPLTWHAPGETKPLDTPAPHVFAFRRGLVYGLGGDVEPNWEEWLARIRQGGHELRLALDCYAWPVGDTS